MIKNYFKSAIRNLLKYKSYSLINISGFAIGLAVSIIIAVYVFNEKSYDTFHENYDKIYRVLRISAQAGDNYLIGYTSGPFAPALENDFPESIKEAIRVMPADGLITYQDKSFFEKKLALADKNFFKVFTFPLLAGSAESVLQKPNSIVLSWSMARKYFGDSDPLGKTLLLDSNFELTVTGIMEEVPSNSHLEFDCVVSIEILDNFKWFSDWWSNAMNTYVLVNSAQQAEYINRQLPAFMDKYFGKDFEKNGNRIDLMLQPLSETYFTNNVRFDMIAHGDKTVVDIFMVIAVFVLIIASINFMNLTTARSGRRAKEIGMRKVLGAARSRIIIQFFTESFVLTFISILISIATVQFLLPVFNSLFGLQLQFDLFKPGIIFLLAGFLILITLLAGSYPALLISSFKPVKVLKSNTIKTSENILIRKGLVVFQFATSFFLIAATLLIINQLDYIQTKNKGFDKESVLIIQLNNSGIRDNVETFKRRLSSIPGVAHVTIASGEPGGYHDNMSHKIEGFEQKPRMRTLFSDEDYVRTFGLQIVSGRDFSKEHIMDRNSAVIINETAVKSLGWSNEQALGQSIRNNMMGEDHYRKIIGIVKDYHYSSLRDKIEPLIISADALPRLVALKVNTNDLNNVMNRIEQTWAGLSPSYPAEISFLDTKLEQLYRKENLESQLFVFFSIISIIIACLGSFALAAFSAEERTKEIGIRKILGSSLFSIFVMLTKDFIKLILISFIVASPLTWFFMQQWLQDFAYRTDLNPMLFVNAALITLMLVLITVSWQAFKAGRADPIESLRYE